jgi:hypothetical protein
LACFRLAKVGWPPRKEKAGANSLNSKGSYLLG